MGIACFETVLYAGDAVARRLPLVSPSVAEPIHDWNYLLRELGMLQHTAAVAEAWQWAGRLLMTAGIALGGRVLWVMANGARTADGEPEPVDPVLAAEEARLRAHLRRGA